MKGKFITFEGSEGSGKSTQIELVNRYLKREGLEVLFLREPGATRIGEQVRRILLDVGSSGMSDECETLLYMAARAQLVRERIIPALRKGSVVLCDRFLDSTIAYQGYGNGVDIGWIKQLGRFSTGGVTPDLTLFFDIDAKKGLGRINRPKDRIERRSVLYHNRVRAGYRTLGRQEPGRIKLIKVNGSKEEIHSVVRKYVNGLLDLS